jgi:hypothetical protein
LGGKQQLRFAVAAFVAGLAWGYVRRRSSSHALRYGVLQGLEWFVAYGGAAALIEAAKGVLDREDGDADTPERVTLIREVVTERRTGTEG